ARCPRRRPLRLRQPRPLAQTQLLQCPRTSWRSGRVMSLITGLGTVYAILGGLEAIAPSVLRPVDGSAGGRSRSRLGTILADSRARDLGPVARRGSAGQRSLVLGTGGQIVGRRLQASGWNRSRLRRSGSVAVNPGPVSGPPCGGILLAPSELCH